MSASLSSSTSSSKASPATSVSGKRKSDESVSSSQEVVSKKPKSSSSSSSVTHPLKQFLAYPVTETQTMLSYLQHWDKTLRKSSLSVWYDCIWASKNDCKMLSEPFSETFPFQGARGDLRIHAFHTKGVLESEKVKYCILPGNVSSVDGMYKLKEFKCLAELCDYLEKNKYFLHAVVRPFDQFYVHTKSHANLVE